MKYTKKELIEKIIDNDLNADLDTIMGNYKDYLKEDYWGYTREYFLRICKDWELI